MKKKIIGFGIMISILLWGRLPVLASDIPVTDSTTGYTPTSFVATNDMLQNNVVVSIPAEMILTYNASTKKLTDTDSVSVRGDIKSGKHLEVSVPANVSYYSSKANVNGTLTFGSGGTEKWTPSQVSSSNNSRQITSTVNASDLDYAGTYSTTITFNISIVND